MSERVLICEDEPSLRELMRIALEGDYEFAEASSIDEALSRRSRTRGARRPRSILRY